MNPGVPTHSDSMCDNWVSCTIGAAPPAARETDFVLDDATCTTANTVRLVYFVPG
jgi:hypothetical protein